MTQTILHLAACVAAILFTLVMLAVLAIGIVILISLISGQTVEVRDPHQP